MEKEKENSHRAIFYSHAIAVKQRSKVHDDHHIQGMKRAGSRLERPVPDVSQCCDVLLVRLWLADCDASGRCDWAVVLNFAPFRIER